MEASFWCYSPPAARPLLHPSPSSPTGRPPYISKRRQLVQLVETLASCIKAYDETIEKLGSEKYPHTKLLQQVKGVWHAAYRTRLRIGSGCPAATRTGGCWRSCRLSVPDTLHHSSD